MNLWLELEKVFEHNEKKFALTTDLGDAINYEHLLKKVRIISKNIIAQVPLNNRVAILNKSSYADALGILSVLASGCTAVPLSLKYGEKNCDGIIKNVQPSILITDIDKLPENIIYTAKLSNTKIVKLNELYRDFKEDVQINYSNKIAMIMSTSGTTGVPKGVLLSHKNILSNLSDIGEYFKLTEKDHILIGRPLYHAAVMTGEFLYGLMRGCRISFYNEEFSPRRLASFIKKVQCTIMCGTPTMFYHIGISKGKVELKNLRIIVVSGERLSRKVAERLIGDFSHSEILNVYGLTEASPRVSYLEAKYFREKVGSVGKALKNINVKIVDKGNNCVRQGEIGELVIQGPNVMEGYWNDLIRTSEKIKDNWLYTGDLAYMDEDGFIYITGRRDDMIIRAGLNIYPQEIENILLENEDVKEAVAWGEADVRYGQSINVAVTAAEHSSIDKDFVMDLCRRRLQSYQWPEKIFILETIPKNASGKISRKEISSLIHV